MAVTLSSLSGSTKTLHVEKDAGGSVVSTVRRSVLPGGLRVITESMAGARSACVGVWVATGSRDEAVRQWGATHFLEHLLFKGTSSRSAMDISLSLDSVGGEFNAFTAREYTCFHARVLGEDLPLAVDVLGDMMTSSLLAPDEVEAEREVILDEIAMHDDDPEDVVGNLFADVAWGPSSLGRNIAGSAESISSLTRRQIHGYYRSAYRPEQMVISVAGKLDHATVVRQVRKAFSRQDFLAFAATPVPPRKVGRPRRAKPGTAFVERPFEQVNLLLGVDGPSRNDPRRYAAGLLSAVLGGGPSSRLFWEVREKRGLAYSIYAYPTHYADAGAFCVGAGCLPGKVDELLKVVREELQRVADEGITEAELVTVKGQLRGGLLLGLEDTSARMTRLAKAELVYDQLATVEEVLARSEAVTLDDIRSLAGDLFARPETLAVVGPAQSAHAEWESR